MKIIKNLALAAFFMLVGSVVVSAADKYAPFERGVYVNESGDSLLYRLLVPQQLADGEKYPLVLFMHGAGERGNDNEKQLIWGGQMWLNPVNRRQYPAFVLAPQCPMSGYWAYNDRPESLAPADMPILEEPTDVIVSVMQLVDSLKSVMPIDPDRVYVMGLSMGGMATYDIAARYPEVFAAAIPICGTVNPARMPSAAKVHFRIYHGDNDDVVPVEASRQAYLALDAAGADVEYIELPGVNHGSWNPAFNDPTFMSWLFGQRR